MANSVYVPGKKHDIFISYAHVDNEPDFSDENGWVTSLVESLQTRLKQLLGRDCFSVWMDPELAKNIDFEPQIVRSLESTATLLVILSPGYLTSPWCTREMRTFLRMMQERRSSGGQVFVVQREKIDHEQRPEEFDGLLGYQFFTEERNKPPRPLNQKRDAGDYYDALNDLANSLSKELKRLRDESAQPVAATVPDSSKSDSKNGSTSEPVATVFLAETTDDIDPDRSQVKRHLEQSGLRVVPSGWYPRDPIAFAEAVQQDLAEAKIFVQLLSQVKGRQLPDQEETYVAFQHRLAQERKLPVLQWRPDDLTPEVINAEVQDESHRKLLLGATVQAVDIEDFKRDVVTRAKHKEKTYDKPPGDALIFVNTATPDDPVGLDLCHFLDERGFGYTTPIYEGKPEEIRQDLRDNVMICDGMIVVYGSSASNWVRGQLREAYKAAIHRPRRNLPAAVYEGPPTPKSPVGMKLPRMVQIACHEGLDEDRLQPFLDELMQSVSDSDGDPVESSVRSY